MGMGKRASDPLRAGITQNCEPPSMDAGNQSKSEDLGSVFSTHPHWVAHNHLVVHVNSPSQTTTTWESLDIITCKRPSQLTFLVVYTPLS